MGLKPGSYEAYCLDQAVGYVGAFIQAELEKAGHRPSKEQRKVEAARQKVLDRYLGVEKETNFADPSVLFG